MWSETEYKYTGNVFVDCWLSGGMNVYKRLARGHCLLWPDPLLFSGWRQLVRLRGCLQPSITDGDTTMHPHSVEPVVANLQAGIWGFRIWFY